MFAYAATMIRSTPKTIPTMTVAEMGELSSPELLDSTERGVEGDIAGAEVRGATVGTGVIGAGVGTVVGGS